MSQKVKTQTFSWAAIVNAADPNRNQPKPIYRFSNGREFTGSSRSLSSRETMLLGGRIVMIGGEKVYV